MHPIERLAAYAVVAHTAVLVIYTAAHGALVLAIPSVLDGIFIGLAMFVSPVVAVLLLVRRPAVAFPLLLVSLIASFTYGAISHYMLTSPDNVAFVEAVGWGLVFHATTAALAAAEVIGILLGALLVRERWETIMPPTYSG